VATIGQFHPEKISASDLQADFTARVSADWSETVPNLINREVTFFFDSTNQFRGTVTDHQGNEITIEYRFYGPVAFTDYSVCIIGGASSSDNLYGTDLIELIP
jgi:hypothetical protein